MSLCKEEKKIALICANCITLDNLHNHFQPLFNPFYNLMLWNWYMLKFLLYRKYVSFSLLWLSLYHKGFRFLKTQQHCQWCDMITKKLVQALAALIDVKIQSIRGMSQLDFSLVREAGCGTDSGEHSTVMSKRKHKRPEREILGIEFIFSSFATTVLLSSK